MLLFYLKAWYQNLTATLEGASSTERWSCDVNVYLGEK